MGLESHCDGKSTGTQPVPSREAGFSSFLYCLYADWVLDEATFKALCCGYWIQYLAFCLFCVSWVVLSHSLSLFRSLTHTHAHIHTHTLTPLPHTNTHTHTHTRMQREKEGDKEKDPAFKIEMQPFCRVNKHCGSYPLS